MRRVANALKPRGFKPVCLPKLQPACKPRKYMLQKLRQTPTTAQVFFSPVLEKAQGNALYCAASEHSPSCPMRLHAGSHIDQQSPTPVARHRHASLLPSQLGEALLLDMRKFKDSSWPDQSLAAMCVAFVTRRSAQN